MSKEVSGGDLHVLLMDYGKICSEEGYLSIKATSIRMNIATYIYDLEKIAKGTYNG